MSAALLTACIVFGVADGDSLKVRCEGRANAISVRLAGIDSPEVAHPGLHIAEQPGGVAARDHLRALCLGKAATVRIDGRDRYGRSLARVSCEGIDASQEQVRSGHAWSYLPMARSPIPRLERQARADGRGLWSAPDPVRPSEWRKMK